jgi:hypothetical protein
LVATVKLAVVDALGTVTLFTLAANPEFEVLMVTTVPPAGAGSLSRTVAVELAPLPPAMVDGLSVSDDAVGAAIAAGLNPTTERANARLRVEPLRILGRRVVSSMGVIGSPVVLLWAHGDSATPPDE